MRTTIGTSMAVYRAQLPRQTPSLVLAPPARLLQSFKMRSNLYPAPGTINSSNHRNRRCTINRSNRTSLTLLPLVAPLRRRMHSITLNPINTRRVTRTCPNIPTLSTLNTIQGVMHLLQTIFPPQQLGILLLHPLDKATLSLHRLSHSLNVPPLPSTILNKHLPIKRVVTPPHTHRLSTLFLLIASIQPFHSCPCSCSRGSLCPYSKVFSLG